MSIFSQDTLALALCMVAAAYIAWRGWQSFARRRSAGCGNGCGTCSSSTTTSPRVKTLVQIDPPPRS